MLHGIVALNNMGKHFKYSLPRSVPSSDGFLGQEQLGVVEKQCPEENSDKDLHGKGHTNEQQGEVCVS